MEDIKKFLDISSGSGDGYGYGYGSGSGDGDGDGYGYGYGDGSGSGSGYGYGSGSGDGSGSGSGYGYGYGSGSGSGDGDGDGYGYGYGSGYGYGYGSGYGYGIKKYSLYPVYIVDSVSTIIYKVRRGIAFGWILNSDLTLTNCVVAKSGNIFAHGEDIHSAMAALRYKLFEGMSDDERIAEFWKAHNRQDKYSCRDFYEWHHRLTGSCEMGRNQFAKDHCIDIEKDKMTVDEFIKLTENSYGGAIIRKLKNEEGI